MRQQGSLHLFAVGVLGTLIVANSHASEAVHASQVMAQPTLETKTSDDKSEKMRQRLEQLFIWRVADRLQLSPKQEQDFTNEYRALSAERLKNSQEQDILLDEIEKSKDDKKQISKFLNAYQVSLKKSSQLQLREMDVMKKLLGNQKVVDYMLLKREMTQRFKDVLKNSAVAKAGEAVMPSAARTLKEPEVIQEK